VRNARGLSAATWRVCKNVVVFKSLKLPFARCGDALANFFARFAIGRSRPRSSLNLPLVHLCECRFYLAGVLKSVRCIAEFEAACSGIRLTYRQKNRRDRDSSPQRA
jgi:hypothetical protein